MLCKKEAKGCVESFLDFLELIETSERSSLDICDVDLD